MALFLTRSRIFAVAAIMLSASSGISHAADNVRVGSKIDTEGSLLGNIIVQVWRLTGLKPPINPNWEQPKSYVGRLLPVRLIFILNIRGMGLSSFLMNKILPGRAPKRAMRK